MTKEEYLKSLSGTEVAIIGYALRFPGASNAEDFWKNIAGEKESIQFLSDAELTELNVSSDTYNRAEFVRAVVEDIENKEYFDHSFFGYTPDEAMVMDPQTRIFHELVWEAIEHAGQATQIDRQKIGLFAGGASSFSHELLSMAAGLSEKIGPQIASRLMNKDYLVSRVAYALNLKGPCFTIQTACSTSLVALHVAVRAVLTGECKMALAGGISIQPEKNKGYLYEEGGVLSNDGHCRAFDADSSGTLFGEGGCVVMLKRLKDAIQDNDTIHAVIKGSAINNDGNRKVGFTAPSIVGQADVIKLAHKIARVEPASLQYIEAHGTGTKLGDPIELQALQLAFGLSQKKSCAIGSVKTNIGHLDTAAGIAGLMKTVLALKNKKLPPSLNFKSPNPNANFDDSPFYVNQHLIEWESNESFRKAGVSSFGIGGTNAHVVIEEAPVFEVKKEEGNSYYLIPVSGKTQNAVNKQKENIAAHAKESNGSLADLSYSLQTGRTPFKYRSFVVTNTIQELAEIWSKRDENWTLPKPAPERQPPLIFMFGGQGSQYYGISKALYMNFEMYRAEVDACLSTIPPSLKKEIQDIILAEGSSENSKGQISTRLTQPLLFVVEYSIARVLINLGLIPDAMIGHSIGEYVAACISGVVSVEDALDLVISRGELMECADAGAMISISTAFEKVNDFISKEVALAAVNSDKSCVLAGTESDISSIEAQLTDLEIPFRRLHTNRAFHSSLMEKVLPAFLAKVKQKKWNSPSIPYISNLTGKYIQSVDVVNPTYWTNHLRNTVYFGAGISELGKFGGGIFIEVGTGKNLGTFVKDQLGVNTTVIETIRHPKADVADDFYFLKAIGNLWCSGKAIVWEQLYKNQRPAKIPLPTYPFERSRFWNDADLATLLSRAGKGKKSNGNAVHAFVPVWRRSLKSISTGRQKSACLPRQRT
jgi:acyl transferase domain-containing protein